MSAASLAAVAAAAVVAAIGLLLARGGSQSRPEAPLPAMPLLHEVQMEGSGRLQTMASLGPAGCSLPAAGMLLARC